MTFAALAPVMLLGRTGCGKSEAVKSAASLISAIGTVTPDSGDASTDAPATCIGSLSSQVM